MCGGDEVPRLFGGMEKVTYYQRVQSLMLGILLTHPFCFIELSSHCRLSLSPIRIPLLHIGAFVGIQSRVSSDRFSYFIVASYIFPQNLVLV